MLILFLILAIPFCCFGQNLNGALMGRAGVHNLSQISASSVGWNSGSFALQRTFSWSLELPSVSASAGNNSFSSKYWNEHIGGNHVYTQSETEAILSKIPAEGLKVQIESSIPVVGIVYKQFGFLSSIETAGFSTVPKDLIHLGLLGNELNKQYDLTNLDGGAQVILNNAAGLGFKAEQEGISDLFFGATFHYYQGLALARVEEAEGNLIITDSLINGSSRLHTIESTNGDGIGFDLSVMTIATQELKIGLSARQLGANLTWQVQKNRLETFYTDSTGLIVDSLDQENYLDRAFHKSSETYGGGTVETALPVIFQANTEYTFSLDWKLSAETLYRIKNSAQGKKGLEIGLASDYRILNWLTGNAGINLGGVWKSRYGLGVGIHTRHYDFDLGLQSNGGLLNDSRGVGFGISHHLKF